MDIEMEEIEVGEYVRTTGIIGKVIKVLSNRVFLDNVGYAVLKKDIAKHSKNIIDLVEVGDYVNGYKILGKRMPISQYEEGIKTVLTHELYEMNCYKVGGEKKC